MGCARARSAAAFSRARGALMATRCVISTTEWSRRARYKTNNDKQAGVHALALARRVNTAARFGARTPPRLLSAALGRPRREIAVSRSLSLSPSVSRLRSSSAYFARIPRVSAKTGRRLTSVRSW